VLGENMNILEDYKNNSELSYLKLEEIIEEIKFLTDFFYILTPNISKNSVFDLSEINILNEKFEKMLSAFHKINWQDKTNPQDLLNTSNTFKQNFQEFLNPTIQQFNLLEAYLYYKFIDDYSTIEKKNKFLEKINENSLLIDNISSELKEKKDNLDTMFKTASDSIQSINAAALEKSDQILEESRRILKGKLAEKYNEQFKNTSSDFKEISNKWRLGLYISIGFLAIALGMVFYFEFNNTDIIKNLSYHLLSTKIGIISLLAWLILFCNKNYSNNKNLSYIFEQKHVMLNTYLAFVDTIDDSYLRDRIAGEIGKIIFEVVDTGFVKSSPESSPTFISQLENIMKKQ
jgi:hypothetical protein